MIVLTRVFFTKIILTFSLIVFFQNAHGQLKAESGLIDAHEWDFENSRLPLIGEWAFYESNLFNEQECKDQVGIYSYFPALWNTPGDAGIGFGTYFLKVIVPDSIHTFCFEIPQVYSSCILWVNGELVAQAGMVGSTKEKTLPKWIYQTASFTNMNDTLSIILQLANFHHYKGGAKDPLILGTPAQTHLHRAWAMGSNVAEIFLLFMTSVAFLILYIKKRDKMVILYFSLLCLTWCIRGACSNLYPIMYVFPHFNWTILVKIEYFTLYGAMVWCILFLNQLFKNISNQIVSYVLIGLNIFFALFTLLTSPLVFSQWVNIYLTVAAITVAYCVFIIIRALLFEQAGALFLAFSLLLAGLVFGYDILAYEKAGYNIVFLQVGYIIIFLMVAMALLLQLGILKAKAGYSEVLTYNDMFSDNMSKDKR